MEYSQQEAFERLPIPNALAKFILPAVLGQLASLILSLTDTFFVGRTGDTAQISAMTICFPILMMASCVSAVFAAGANVNVAAAISCHEQHRAKQFSAFSIYTASGIVVLLSLLLLAVKTPLLTLLGTDAASMGFCKGYLLWTFHVGCVPLAIATVSAQLFSAEGETRISGIGIAGGGLLNAVLDPIFVFVLDMGVVGAGLATCVSDYAMLFFFLVMYFRKRRTTVLSLHPKDYHAGDGIARLTLSVGLPAGLTMLMLNFCDFLRNYLLGTCGGQLELAAWGIVQKLGNAVMLICVGIAQGVRPLIAYNFAADNSLRLRKLIRGAFLIMYIYCILVFLCMFLFPSVWVRIFLTVDDAAATANRFLRLWIPCMLGMGATELFNAIFQSMGRWRIALADVLIAKGGMFFLMLLMRLLLGTTGVVLSQPIVDIGTGLVLLIIYLTILRRSPA